MFRLFLPGIGGFLLLALWLYCIFDVISTDDVLVRNLPKMVWLLLVIFVPTIGSLAWLLLGRPLYAGWRPGSTEVRPPPARPSYRGPEDSPSWSGGRSEEDLRKWEEDLRRREQRLRGDEDPPGFTPRW